MSQSLDVSSGAALQLREFGARIIEDDGQVRLIDCSEAQVDDDSLHLLCSFPELRSLSLADTDIGDEGLRHIESLTKLETLDLSTTQITDQ